LLIDADLRRPKQHQIFNLKNHDGLSNYLTMDLDLNKIIKTTLVPSLYLINSGPVPPNPAELLGSDRMKALLDKLKAAFDFILIDTPPFLSVTDSQIVGNGRRSGAGSPGRPDTQGSTETDEGDY